SPIRAHDLVSWLQTRPVVGGTPSSALDPLALHDALPSCDGAPYRRHARALRDYPLEPYLAYEALNRRLPGASTRELEKFFVEHRSEEHTSELQSRENLVCRLLLEKNKPLQTSTVE